MKKLFALMALLGACAPSVHEEKEAKVCDMPAYCERQGFRTATSESGERYCVGGEKHFFDFTCAHPEGMTPYRTCPTTDPLCVDRPREPSKKPLAPGVTEI